MNDVLVPCPSCHRHVYAREPRCPFCDASHARARIALSVALTMALSACPTHRDSVEIYGAPSSPRFQRAPPTAPPPVGDASTPPPPRRD